MAEMVKQYDVHANQIMKWKKQLLSGAPDVFSHWRQGLIHIRNQHRGLEPCLIRNPVNARCQLSCFIHAVHESAITDLDIHSERIES